MDNIFSHMHELINTVLQVRFTDLEKERRSCEELLKLSSEYSYVYASAFAYTYLGDYYLAQNDASLSGPYLYEAKQLCSKDNYPALYMKACHLLGFYYHLINDEQNALQFYMESIEVAEELGDVYQVCNAWNNIADMFQRHKQYDEAIRYYTKAYDVMCKNNLQDARLHTIVLYNLAEISGFSDKVDRMEQYLIGCEAITNKSVEDESFHRLCCKSGRFLQASFRKQKDEARSIATEILESDLFGVQDRYIKIEFLLPITQGLVILKDEEYAKRYLDLLNEYCSIDDISCIQRLVELRVLYAETFSNHEKLNDSYQEYCHAMRGIIAMEDDVRVSGMNAKIHLQEVMHMHETTLQENKRLEDEAHIDDLTNLYNRRYLNLMIEKNKTSTNAIGIIMLDIDYFKEYNDTYGHIHGDLVLRNVGDILRQYSNENIIPCRYGGDEFTCFCMNQSDEGIETFIKNIEHALIVENMEHLNSKCEKRVTLSIGFCNGKTNKNQDIQTILKHADQALYRTKMNGRNGWSSYSAM